MGAYSELDIDLRYGNTPFEDADGTPAFVDGGAFAEDENLCATPPAGAGNVPQAEPASVSPAQLMEQQAIPPAQPVEQQAVPPAQPVEQQAVPAESSDNPDKAAETAANAMSEDEKKKAHEEAEAKRKAEFDARQAAKKAAEKEQLDHLAAMSNDEVLNASMKRVSADTEKLTRRNMKECVAEYIQTMCIEDPAFARKTMHPRKTMIRCFQYISRKAWDYIQDELKANGIQPGPGQQAYGCDIPDDLCYQWAVDYFNDPDAKEDHEDEEKFVPKPYIGGSTSKSKSTKKAKDKAKDKKADAPKKAAESAGQLTLGDFAMPEEKAG